jgi:hypothetical protein
VTKLDLKRLKSENSLSKILDSKVGCMRWLGRAPKRSTSEILPTPMLPATSTNRLVIQALLLPYEEQRASNELCSSGLGLPLGHPHASQ